MRSVHKLGQLSAGQVLSAEGLVSGEQVVEMEQEARSTGERITDIAVARGLVTEFDVAKAMARHLQMPYLSPALYAQSEELLDLFPDRRLLHARRVFPLDRFGDVLLLATCGDLDPGVISEIEQLTGCTVSPVIALASDIETMLSEHYPLENLGAEVGARLDELFGS